MREPGGFHGRMGGIGLDGLDPGPAVFSGIHCSVRGGAGALCGRQLAGLGVYLVYCPSCSWA